MTVTQSGGAGASLAKSIVWFVDTSALITLAVYQPLHDVVVSALSGHRRVLVRAVVVELEGLAGGRPPTSKWAVSALKQLNSWGEPVKVDIPGGRELALRFQDQLAAGRPLKHALEHYGEAAIVALASRARMLVPRMLSDDYDARVLAKNNGVEPVSVHRLLSSMIAGGGITDAQAAHFADELHSAGRAADYTAAELRTGRLGRAGRP